MAVGSDKFDAGTGADNAISILEKHTETSPQGKDELEVSNEAKEEGEQTDVTENGANEAAHQEQSEPLPPQLLARIGLIIADTCL